MSDLSTDLDLLREGIEAVLSATCDRAAVHNFVDGKRDLDREIWNIAGENGWLAIGLPEEHGGLGFGIRGLDVLLQELGRYLVPGPYLASLTAAQWLSELGEEQWKQENLADFATGMRSAAMPATPAIVDTALRAELRNGQLTVSGNYADLIGSPSADVAIVPFIADDETRLGLVQIDGVAARLTPASLWDATRQALKLECTHAVLHLALEGPAVRAGQDKLMQYQALAVAADSLGGAEEVFNQTVEFLKVRQQFGAAIGSFQALKHRAANLKLLLETSRQLAALAVDASDSGEDGLLWSLMAKASVTDNYATIAGDCVQLHGGLGFTWEYDCHLFQKRATLNQMLVDRNGALRDRSIKAFVRAVDDDRSCMEFAA